MILMKITKMMIMIDDDNDDNDDDDNNDDSGENCGSCSRLGHWLIDPGARLQATPGDDNHCWDFEHFGKSMVKIMTCFMVKIMKMTMAVCMRIMMMILVALQAAR